MKTQPIWIGQHASPMSTQPDSPHEHASSHGQPSLHSRYDAVLFDLDGVIYRGPTPVPFAVDSIKRLSQAGVPVVYVTNNASRTPQQVADHLVELGIDTTGGQIRTAAQAAAAYIAQHYPGETVLLVGGEGLATELDLLDIPVVHRAEDDPTVVVQGFSPDLAWPQLAEAAYAIGTGASYVASNLDATLPTQYGMAPGNGSLVAAVVHATGVHPVATGKPSAEIFHQAAEQAGATNPLVVGDRLDTDIAGAHAAGYDSLHVLTGVDQIAQVLTAPVAQRPTHLALDLRELAAPRAEVSRDGHWWVVGNACARVCDGEIEIAAVSPSSENGRTGQSITLDQYRALVAAGWEAIDSGIELRELPPLTVSPTASEDAHG